MTVAWVRWFLNDWQASSKVGGMTAEERGVYFELLLHQARAGPFAWDPEALQWLLRIPAEVLVRCWPKVRAGFLEDDAGLWFNAKMDEEVIRGEQFSSEAQSERGKKRAKTAKRGPDGTFVSSQSPAKPPATAGPARDPAKVQPAPTPTPTPKKNQKTPPRATRGSPPKGGFDPASLPEELRAVPGLADAWEGWVDNRKRHRAPFTKRSHTIATNKLRRWLPKHGAAAVITALEDATESGWKGVWEPRSPEARRTEKSRSQAFLEAVSGTRATPPLPEMNNNGDQAERDGHPGHPRGGLPDPPGYP